MKKENIASLANRLAIILLVSVITAAFILANVNKQPASDATRVACVGDSLTQSTAYPYDLWMQLGKENYFVRNFGVGSTTVSLDSETPYMNTTAFQDALEFQPQIVIIMLGTNDAQPSLHIYNASFVDDYMKLIDAFQRLPSDPEIWIALPPPIFSDQGGKMSPEYFRNTVIPLIEQVANEADLPLIDVYSALVGYSDYFPDGVHPNIQGAKLIADEIYRALKT